MLSWFCLHVVPVPSPDAEYRAAGLQYFEDHQESGEVEVIWRLIAGGTSFKIPRLSRLRSGSWPADSYLCGWSNASSELFWVHSWKFMRLWICCLKMWGYTLLVHDTPQSNAKPNPTCWASCRDRLWSCHSCTAPRHDSFNMLYLKNVPQLDSARHGQDQKIGETICSFVLWLWPTKWQETLQKSGKLDCTAGELKPSFQIYSADVPTVLEEGHVEGWILDHFGWFWTVLSLRMSAVISFLSSLVSLRKHKLLYDDNVWSGLVWGQKNTR